MNRAPELSRCLRFVGAAGLVLLAAPTPSLALDARSLEKLHASDGSPLDLFGISVAVDGQIAVIGAHWDADNGTQSGSAYVFRRDGESWIEEQKLLAADGAVSDRFGFTVTVSDDTIIVGAPGGGENGSAYVFRFDGSAWMQEQKLVPSNADTSVFGRSVAMAPGCVVIGAPNWSSGPAPGSAFVFLFDGSAWIEVQELVPEDGDPGDFFGQFVAVSGEVAVVGADRDDDLGLVAGAAYVFRRVEGSRIWIEEAKLLPSDGRGGDNFGRAVSIDGDVALVGAPGNGGGASYVFRRDDRGLWVEQQKLQPSNLCGGDGFGLGTVKSDTVLVGAPFHCENGSAPGSAYIFRYDGVAWCEQQQLLPAELEHVDRFGQSVAIAGDTALVGAIGDDDNGTDAGAVWVFTGLNESVCPWDIDGDGFVGILDLLALLASWGQCGACCSADINGNGSVGSVDLLLLVIHWGPCPA